MEKVKEGKIMKVAILESLGISKEELEARKAPFIAQGVEFVEYAKTTDTDALIEEAKDADAMIIANMPMPGQVISACENLKFIDVAFTGVDHVGLSAAKEKGIKVSNASGYSNEAVAELALGMILSLYRYLREVESSCRIGSTKDGFVGYEIKGKTVGIVGLGKIGTRSAEIYHTLGADIVSYSRTIHSDAPDYVKQVSLDELLAVSDIVILHTPLNDDSRGLINADKLKLMKKSAILINVARGPVVVSRDLAEALKNGTIAGAGIDVFDKEPPLDVMTEPILYAPNCLVTPHVAFATKESMTLRAEIVFENLKAFMDGGQINKVL